MVIAETKEQVFKAVMDGEIAFPVERGLGATTALMAALHCQARPAGECTVILLDSREAHWWVGYWKQLFGYKYPPPRVISASNPQQLRALSRAIPVFVDGWDRFGYDTRERLDAYGYKLAGVA